MIVGWLSSRFKIRSGECACELRQQPDINALALPIYKSAMVVQVGGVGQSTILMAVNADENDNDDRAIN